MPRPCLGVKGDPPCPALVDPPHSRCSAHEREKNARKEAKPHRWVYKDRRWWKCRRRALRRAGFRCQVVEAGERCPIFDPSGKTLHAHHHPLSVVELLEAGLDPFDDSRVVVACESHHGRIEALLRSLR